MTSMTDIDGNVCFICLISKLYQKKKKMVLLFLKVFCLIFLVSNTTLYNEIQTVYNYDNCLKVFLKPFSIVKH